MRVRDLLESESDPLRDLEKVLELRSTKSRIS